MEGKFITKPAGVKIPTVTEIRRVAYRPIFKRVGTLDCGPFGNIPHSVQTDKIDKSRLDIDPWHGTGFVILATREGVHSHIRRLRDQEAKILDEIDAQIAALREQRKEALKLAWQKGNTVTVKELIEVAENGK
jgi:hypothetical protein